MPTIKTLAEAQTKELEELENDYRSKKEILTGFVKGAVINEVDYRNLDEEYEDLITVEMGASAIKKLLEEINLDQLVDDLHEEAEKRQGTEAKAHYEAPQGA